MQFCFNDRTQQTSKISHLCCLELVKALSYCVFFSCIVAKDKKGILSHKNNQMVLFSTLYNTSNCSVVVCFCSSFETVPKIDKSKKNKNKTGNNYSVQLQSSNVCALQFDIGFCA